MDHRELSPPPPSIPYEDTEKMVIYEPGSGLSPDTPSTSTLILDFQLSEQCEINVYYLSHPIYGVFVIVAQTD